VSEVANGIEGIMVLCGVVLWGYGRYVKELCRQLGVDIWVDER